MWAGFGRSQGQLLSSVPSPEEFQGWELPFHLGLWLRGMLAHVGVVFSLVCVVLSSPLSAHNPASPGRADPSLKFRLLGDLETQLPDGFQKSPAFVDNLTFCHHWGKRMMLFCGFLLSKWKQNHPGDSLNHHWGVLRHPLSRGALVPIPSCLPYIQPGPGSDPLPGFTFQSNP